MTNVAIEVLNRAFRADPNAIHALLCNRVPCNRAIVDDTTIVVDNSVVSGAYTVGMMGIINGILGQAGSPLVAAQFSYVKGRREILGFCEYNPAIQAD